MFFYYLHPFSAVIDSTSVVAWLFVMNLQIYNIVCNDRMLFAGLEFKNATLSLLQ